MTVAEAERAIRAHEGALLARDELEGQVNAARRREREAVDAHIASGADTLSYAFGSAEEKYRRKRLELESRLLKLQERELPERERLAAEARRELALASIGEAERQANGLDAPQRAAVEAIATAYTDLLRGHADYVAAVEARERLYLDLE